MNNSITNKKYLSALVERFFNNYLYEEYPLFVEFIQEWFKYAESSYVDENGETKFGFWKTLSNLQYFIDIENVPNEVLKYFMMEYANNFKDIYENIPYFVEFETDSWGNMRKVLDSYGNPIYKYDNIRLFLKTSKKFFQSKGNYNSFYYLFKLFGGVLKIQPLDKLIIKSSDGKSVLSSVNNDYGKLYHIHGVYPDPYITNRENSSYDWWYTYYSYELTTDLDEKYYKPLVLELLNPAGMYCKWNKIDNPEDLEGWGINSWGDSSKWGIIFYEGSNPQISTSSSDIYFSTTSVGLETSWRTIEIHNMGEDDLEISSILLSDNINFTIDLTGGSNPIGGTFPVTTSFGNFKTFNIKFNPQYISNFTGRIVITSNSENNSTKNIILNGYGV